MSKLSKWQKCLPISSIVLSLCFFLPTYSQTQRNRRKANNTSPCALELKTAPTIHGVKLGMTVNEFLSAFPSAREASKLKVGVQSYDFYTERGVAVDIAWFLDGNLVFVGFHYPEVYPSNMDNFTRQMAAKFGLPSVGWKNISGVREIKCKGFRVAIGRPDYPSPNGPPYLQLEDISGYGKLMAR
jgi:hypothetical protein